MQNIFALVPVAAYLMAGCLKFVINSFKEKNLAFKEIGMGGMPSTHNAISSSVLFMLIFEGYWGQPLIGISVAHCLIILIDSLDLRNRIGKITSALKGALPDNPNVTQLRNKLGHTLPEALGGYLVGAFVGYGFSFLS